MASPHIPAPVSTPVSRREHLVELLGRVFDPGKRRGIRAPYRPGAGRVLGGCPVPLSLLGIAAGLSALEWCPVWSAQLLPQLAQRLHLILY